MPAAVISRCMMPSDSNDFNSIALGNRSRLPKVKTLGNFYTVMLTEGDHTTPTALVGTKAGTAGPPVRETVKPAGPRQPITGDSDDVKFVVHERDINCGGCHVVYPFLWENARLIRTL